MTQARVLSKTLVFLPPSATDQEMPTPGLEMGAAKQVRVSSKGMTMPASQITGDAGRHDEIVVQAGMPLGFVYYSTKSGPLPA